MRLLVFSPYYPPHIGGLETHALEFNRHFATAAERIIVFTPGLPCSAPPQETLGNITVWRFPAWEPIHNYPLPQFWQPAFWRLWRELRLARPTHVLSRTRFFFTSLMAWRFARSRDLPWLHVEHGSDFVHFHSRLKSWLGKLYDQICGRFVLRNADRVVANSLASTAFVAQLSGRSDCETIYRGVETEMIIDIPEQPALRARFPGRVIAVFLGRLIDGKGVLHLLEALKSVSDNRLAVAIIGSGPDEERLKTYIRSEHLEESVMLLGHRPLPEALGLLKAADIFVNPSYSEGIPTAVIEAALLKKAIIATAVGGTSEIISGDGDGYLVPPGDSQAIAEKLTLLLDDTRRIAMGERAYTAAKDKFSWERAVGQYRRIIDTLRLRSERLDR